MFHPTQGQDWLLKAALLQGNDCLRAWRQWVDSTVLDDVDHASQRLLPLARWNVMRHGDTRVREGRVAGIHRYYWCQTTVLLNELRPLLETLEEEGVEPILTGDLAMALTLYPDLGCRPVDRCDLLVPEEKMTQAYECLLNEGCLSRRGNAHWIRPIMPWPQLLSTPNGSALALHALPGNEQAEDAEYSRTVEQSARPLSRDGLSVRVVDTPLLLVDACLQAGSPITANPIKWIADAALAIQSSAGNLDCEKVCALAQGHALTIRMRHMLTLLRDGYRIPVPERCLQHLRTLPSTRWERIEQMAQTQYGVAGRLLMQYGFQYWRVARWAGVWRALRAYPYYLTRVWDLEHPRRIPIFVLAKLAVSTKQVLTGTRRKERQGVPAARKSRTT